MSRIDTGLYDFVTDEFLGRAPADELNAALAKLKALTGPQLAADAKAKRAVRDGIDRIYRELDARAKGGTSITAPSADARPAAKDEPPKKPAKAEPKPAAKAAVRKAEAMPVARAEPPPPVQPAPPAAPTAVAAVELPEGEEFEEEDDSETFGEAGDFD